MDSVAQLRIALKDRYDIEREVGAGGMATVYLARDLRHDRHVALKLLNPDLGAVLGLERFLAEIKVTANLQHPNLLPLFDSGEAGGLLFYVMPYVEGETLRVRLEREKQLPIDEAVRISVAIANALDYAHQHGVIHRDLKPENILMQAGQPVVADFGIALAVSKAGGNRITQTGLSLGTPQYMSPEQATGDRVIDGRSDIYSLAAITYEMLSGEPPHTGSTAQAIIARVLTDRPRSIRSTRSAVPEYVEAAIEHGLEKLPADRFSTAREFAEALQGRGAMTTTASASRQMATRTSGVGWRARLRDPLVVALAVAFIVTGGAAARFAMRPAPATLKTIRYVLSAPDSLRPVPGAPWPAAISPDGGSVVYFVPGTGVASTGGLALLRSNEIEPHIIPGTEGGLQPTFSPDGQWLAFQITGKERKVRLDGSAPITISSGGAANGAAWTTRDELIVGATGAAHGLSHVPTAGGELVPLTHPDSAHKDADHLWPLALDDGRTIVFVIYHGSVTTSELAVTSLDDGKVTKLGVKGVRPLAMLDGYLVYLQADGIIMARPFDARGRKLTGVPIPVHDPVIVEASNNGNSYVYVSSGGAMVSAKGTGRSMLVEVGRGSSSHPIIDQYQTFFTPRISSDGSRLLVGRYDGTNANVWHYDATTKTFSAVSGTDHATGANWAPDGKGFIVTRVAGEHDAASGSGEIWRFAGAGGAGTKLADIPGLVPQDAQIAPDGKTLLFSAYRSPSWSLFVVRLDSSGVVRDYLKPLGNTVTAGVRLSPDGRWAAYDSDESGTNELYVRSYPNPATRIQVSAGGGSDPTWARDGAKIYYRSGRALMAARISTAPELRTLGRDTVVANADPILGTLNGVVPNYDVDRDGRIIGLTPLARDFNIVVSPNWITEFRERIRAARH